MLDGNKPGFQNVDVLWKAPLALIERPTRDNYLKLSVNLIWFHIDVSLSSNMKCNQVGGMTFMSMITKKGQAEVG